MTAPLTPQCRLDPAPDLRAIDGYRILVGGAPFRILRLSASGAGLVKAWFAGEPVGDGAARHRLARRLEDNGMAHLRWPSAPSADAVASVTVVVPTRDDRPALERTLASLSEALAGGDAPPPATVVVVDDGSVVPPPALDPRFETIRREVPGGPGAARQSGLDRVGTPLVLFIDAGVIVDRATIDGLLAAFDDPQVVAAAPRVRSEPRPGPAARYEQRRSPLDLGPTESLVGPGRAVPYVPTACLAVRTDAVTEVGGFDPALRFGEDVDLVWRLGRIGLVRYLPSLTASHRPRPTLRALAGQRRSYGSSAAPLARRHGHEALTPCRISPWSALVLVLGLAGRPVLAGVTAVGTGIALRPKIEPMPAAGAEAMSLTLRGHGYGALSMLTALMRSWAPFLLPALIIGGRPRRLVGRAVGAAVLRRVLDGPRRPADLVNDVAVGVIDDLAYCAGLWQGAARERSGAALRPVVASWPGRSGSTLQRVSTLVERLRGRPKRVTLSPTRR